MPKKINPDAKPSENIFGLNSYLQNAYFPVSLSKLAQEFKVSKPTMLRYLLSLENSGYGQIECEKRGREHYYSLAKHNASKKIALSAEGLQQLALCRDLISNILPPSMKTNVEIALNQATAYLPANVENPLYGLPSIAMSFTRGKIDYADFQDKFKMLLTAIRDKAVCTIKYTKGDGEEQSFDYAPLKVLVIGEAIHVNGWKVTDKGKVETIKDHPTDLLLHRIKELELTIRKSDELPEIVEHNDGYYGFMKGEVFDATIRFYNGAAIYISERTWSSNQNVKQHKDGSIELTLTVQSVWELKSFILGFGENAKVISPQWLKDEIIESLTNSLSLYEKNS